MSVDSATEWVRGMVLALTEPHYHQHATVRWDGSSWIVAVPTSAVGALLGDNGVNAGALRRLAWAGAGARRLLQDAPWLRPESVLSIRDGGSDALGWVDPLGLDDAVASGLDFLGLAVRGPVAKGEVTIRALPPEHERFRPGQVCASVGVSDKQVGRLLGRGGANLEDLRTLLRCHLRARGWRGGSTLILQPPTIPRSPDA